MGVIRHLIVEETGAFVSKHQGRLQVMVNGKAIEQAPLMHLEGVLLLSQRISISTDALTACSGAGIPVYVVDIRGRPCASLYSSGLVGTVRTRRAQIEAYQDGRGVVVARQLASAKIQNQAGLLRYMAKYRKENAPTLYHDVREAMTEALVYEAKVARVVPDATTIEILREPLMVVEAHAAQHYWRGFGALLPEGVVWRGRVQRGGRDPVNSLLNYGYGILYGAVERAIVLAGLDPYAGFIHADRPGKFSLVLDMIEPFRAPVVDRAILNFIGKGGTIAQEEKGLLTAETRKAVAERVLERLEKPALVDGQQFPIRHLIQQQARELAAYLRRNRTDFVPFVARW